MSIMSVVQETVEDLKAAQRLIENLQGLLNPSDGSAVVSCQEFCSKLENIDDKIFNAISHLGDF